jgi:hypothetical protein
MRLFVRAAGWGRGYYWTEVTAEGSRDAGQVPVDNYLELLRDQDALAPSLSLYHGPRGYQVLCLGLASRRNEPGRRVITNSLLVEWAEERPPRLFAASVLAAGADDGPVFRAAFEQEVDRCIGHDTEGDHYRVDPTALQCILDAGIAAMANLGEPEAFPDDIFVERLFARNSPERRVELHAGLCRYEIPVLSPDLMAQLLLAVTGLEDAEALCAAGAWVVLSGRCGQEAWTIFSPGDKGARKKMWDRC